VKLLKDNLSHSKDYSKLVGGAITILKNIRLLGRIIPYIMENK